MRATRGGKRGTLMVRVLVRIPDQFTQEERELYQRLGPERRRQADKPRMTG